MAYLSLYVGFAVLTITSIAAAWAHISRVRPGLPPASGAAVFTAYAPGDRAWWQGSRVTIREVSRCGCFAMVSGRDEYGAFICEVGLERLSPAED